ncbi:hypothetical protein [Tropicimonas marinistellae]|uniref:hypothetical protein n=1 Tax=Tropicimonas marinistellae TaxID=1739787 RepID=UPI000836D886|nr:hypothetical protein [Tropicimonas marinistellae]
MPDVRDDVGALYATIEPAEFCYLSEAALWIALGRVPPRKTEWIDDDAGEDLPNDGNGGASPIATIDIRLGEDAYWLGLTRDVGQYRFSEPEFRAVGTDIDHQRYLRALQGLHGMDVEEFLDDVRRLARADRMETLGWAPPGDQAEWDASDAAHQCAIEETVEKAVPFVLEYEWARAQEEVFTKPLASARHALLVALEAGRLSARGWQEFDRAERIGRLVHDPVEGQPAGRFVDIRPEDWRAGNHDWDSDRLRSPRGEFDATMVRFSDLRGLFPTPNCPAEPFAGQATIGGVVTSGAETTGKRRKGRPPMIPRVQAAYKRVFPLGHGNIPEKVVLRAVERELGESVSQRTLNRAINTID